MNVAVYCPLLKLSRLTQSEPLGLFCCQLPFGLAGNASLACPWHTARNLTSAAGDCKRRAFAQHGSKAGMLCTQKK